MSLRTTTQVIATIISDVNIEFKTSEKHKISSRRFSRRDKYLRKVCREYGVKAAYVRSIMRIKKA